MIIVNYDSNWVLKERTKASKRRMAYSWDQMHSQASASSLIVVVVVVVVFMGAEDVFQGLPKICVRHTNKTKGRKQNRKIVNEIKENKITLNGIK